MTLEPSAPDSAFQTMDTPEYIKDAKHNKKGADENETSISERSIDNLIRLTGSVVLSKAQEVNRSYAS